MSNKTKKLLILNLPYFIAGLVCTNLGEAWRIAEGADMSEKLLGFLSALGAAFFRAVVLRGALAGFSAASAFAAGSVFGSSAISAAGWPCI